MNFANIKTIFQKELRSFFNSPVAYIVIVVFLAILGWYFTNYLFLMNMSSLRVIFEITPYLLLVFAPAITMRLISEEKKAGTLELLMTKPIREYEIIIGKFLAAWVLYLIALLPTLSYYITVSALGSIDMGSVIGGYLGLILVGAVFIAISVFASAITENQVVAFIVSFLIVFIFFMFDRLVPFAPGYLASILEYLSIDFHFSNIARGVIDTRDVLYYISTVGFTLFLGTVALQKRRW
jgi:ABC-2 type transport system permease protein